jgi:hypothetical protein
MLFFVQISYIICILTFPMFPEINDRWMVGSYFCAFTLRNLIYSCSHTNEAIKLKDNDFYDYFTFWGTINFAHISTMLVYLIWHQPEVYSILILFAFINNI